ncbi:MAG TPA: sensor histidine kinase [Caulobacteraceae bacterium]
MTLAPTAEELANVDEAAASAPPPPRRPPSLVRRLVTLHFVLSVAVLALVGVALSAMFTQRSTAAFDNQLSENVLNLVAGASVDETGQAEAPALTDERAERVYSGRYWQMYAAPAKGPVRSIARSRSLWDAPDLALPPGGTATVASQPGHPIYYNGDGPLKQPLRVVAEEVRLAGAADPVVFLEAQDRSPLDADIRAFATTTALALLVLAAMLIAGVMLQVRVGLTPLFLLRSEVAAVRTGKSERVAGDWPAELEPLASELNALVAHNQDVVERQRTHVGNLAHALKTPLSVMAAEAEARPGPLADVVARQAAVMRQQVDHHLRRARAAARQQAGERTDVAEVLEELSLTLERIFRDKGVEVDWRAPDDLYFQGEKQDFLELAGNVMENACKWCRARVRIDAAAISAGQLRLTVEDDGPGLAASDRDEVLRRGARLDETAPGSGLGLSIVDELAKAYGGSLALSDTTMGGLKVSLTLPRAEA